MNYSIISRHLKEKLEEKSQFVLRENRAHNQYYIHIKTEMTIEIIDNLMVKDAISTIIFKHPNFSYEFSFYLPNEPKTYKFMSLFNCIDNIAAKYKENIYSDTNVFNYFETNNDLLGICDSKYPFIYSFQHGILEQLL